jgi:catechol 2,3-dioxygenase-like lactoylglutathione lyase family enzyme
MHRSRLCHITISCSDLDRAVAFWGQALDALQDEVGPNSDHIYRRLAIPHSDIRVLLQRVAESGESIGGVHVDIEADDVDAEVARLEGLGARRVRLVAERGYRFWVLEDPDRNAFCVIEPEFSELLARASVWP